MSAPSQYKTLAGLLKATERVLAARLKGCHRVDGQSVGMWLVNAEFCAETTFKAGADVRGLVAKYAVTRPQDLQALDGNGHAVFGQPLPTRDYIVGDNLPGIGRVDDATDDQLFIAGSWYHRRCFDKQAA